jgi:hypothetical protein
MFASAVEKFLNDATWLTPADDVWAVALRACAVELDENGVQSALISQYRQILTLLEKRRPTATQSDPVADAINGLRK